MRFRDRSEAGQQLAQELLGRPGLAPGGPGAQPGPRPVVLALPRGGVPVGFEIARALHAPLDIVLVRKIGAPLEPELAVGAVVDGDKPETVINEDVRAALDVPESYIREETAVQLKEIERRRTLYRGGRAPVAVSGRTAILVDDGIATGATMRAALRATRRRKPSAVILAVPVSARDTLEEMRHEADDVVCLHAPLGFGGVGQFYHDFRQVDDATVAALLRGAAA